MISTINPPTQTMEMVCLRVRKAADRPSKEVQALKKREDLVVFRSHKPFQLIMDIH
tara:strand:+ start:478 stop:645 length:168 start_codon:yes stop_codon:yes gene_type:complete